MVRSGSYAISFDIVVVAFGACGIVVQWVSPCCIDGVGGFSLVHCGGPWLPKVVGVRWAGVLGVPCFFCSGGRSGCFLGEVLVLIVRCGVVC